MAVVLMLALVCTMLSFSTAKVSHAALNSTGSNKITTQAQNYAESKANLLKKTDYYKLSAQGKANIPNSNHFSDEVVIGTETSLPSDSSVKQKECVVNVYQEEETIPRATIRLIRYSRESSTLPKGSIIPWFGQLSNIPSGFALCDGKNGTPDLRNRFLVGAGNQYKLSDTGGAVAVKLESSQVSSHYHTFGFHSGNNGGYFLTSAGTFINGPRESFVRAGKWNGSGGGGYNGWDGGSGTNFYKGQNMVTSNAISTEVQKAHENRPPYYALYYIMKL